MGAVSSSVSANVSPVPAAVVPCVQLRPPPLPRTVMDWLFAG